MPAKKSKGYAKRNALLGVGLFILFIVSLFAADYLRTNVLQDKSQASNPNGDLTFRPTVIATSAPELISPLRGHYRWSTTEEIISEAKPAFDHYKRYAWNELETSKDVYKFDELIGADIRAAAARGQKFSLRVRTLRGEGSVGFLPDYIWNDSNCAENSNGTHMPKWDAAGDNCFKVRSAKLLTELGKYLRGELASHPVDYRKNIGWIDIGMYGQYGEWSCSWCSNRASDQTQRDIVQMHIDAFGKDFQLLMMAKTNVGAPLEYAMERPISSNLKYLIGWRVDCLGNVGYFDFPTKPIYVNAWENKGMKDRWKYAPVATEYCAHEGGPNWSVAQTDTNNFHISLLSNGNFVPTNSLTYWNENPQVHDAVEALGRSAGYRLIPKVVTSPTSIVPGISGAVFSVSWENVGNAPVYENWTVYYQLRDKVSHTPIVELASSANLRSILPTNGVPVVVTDTFNLPASLAGNTLVEFAIVAKDPTGFRKPLTFAVQGRDSNGSYVIGDIPVGTLPGSATATPLPTPTTPPPTASSTPRPSSTPVATSTPVSTATASPVPTAPPGGSITVTLETIEDAMLDKNRPTTNFGATSELSSDGSPEKLSYLKYDLRALQGRTIDSVRLQFKPTDSTSSRHDVKVITDSSWKEDLVTYNTRKSTGATLGSRRGALQNQVTSITLDGSRIQEYTGRYFAIAIQSNGSDRLGVASREAANSVDRPVLIITYR